jgi:hypothetical protein
VPRATLSPINEQFPNGLSIYYEPDTQHQAQQGGDNRFSPIARREAEDDQGAYDSGDEKADRYCGRCPKAQSAQSI